MATAVIQASKQNHLTLYKTSLSRDSLKCGYYKPLSVTVVRETLLDEGAIESFYHPAVMILDLLYKAKNSIGHKAVSI